METRDTALIVHALGIDDNDHELRLALKNVLEKRKVYQETAAKQVQREAFKQQREVQTKDKKARKKSPKKKPLEDQQQVGKLKSIQDFIDPAICTGKILPVQENHTFLAIIVVVTTFKSNIPAIPKSARTAAQDLHEYLTDPVLGGLKKANCKLLINPSIIEFNVELDSFKSSPSASSFTLILISHGVRVVSGPHIGSFILFPESRLSSIDELLLTSMSDKKLAQSIHQIPSKFKFLALDICQDQDIAPNIHDVPIKGRIHADFAPRLLRQIHEIDTQEKQAQGIPDSSEPLPIFILEACKARVQTALFDGEDNEAQSLFIRSLLDAFQGGAASQGMKDYGKNWCEDDTKLPFLYVRDIFHYVISRVQFYAYRYSQRQEAKQPRTTITTGLEIPQDQTPQLTSNAKDIDFPLSMAPRPPTVVPKPPKVLGATTPSSIAVTWDQVPPRQAPSKELLPSSPIVGYQVEFKGIGRACDEWHLVGTKLVHTYDQVVCQNFLPPTTSTAVALTPDAGYHFRVRARNVGGWGPYSPPSEPIWTRAVTSSKTYEKDAASAAQLGPAQVVDWMKKYATISQVQLMGCRALLQLALEGSTSLSPQGAKAVYESGALDVVGEALRKFPEDAELQLAGIHVVGRLVKHYDIRAQFSSIQVGGAKFLLENIMKKFPATLYLHLHTTASLVHQSLLHPMPRQLKKSEAARRIQGLFRRKMARRTLQELAAQLYQQVYDAASGTVYYYNTRTGQATWSAPSALM